MKDDLSCHDQNLVERTLSEGFRLLRFPAPLERAFVLAHADERTIKLILASLISIVVFGAILVADYLMTPEQFGLAVKLRLGVYAPFMLLSVVILHRMSLPRLNEWMIVLVAFVASSIVAVLAKSGVNATAFTKVVELIIVVVFVAVFTRFWPMVLLSAMVMCVHGFVVMDVVDVIGTVRLGSTLLLLTTIVFALYACYTREYNDRQAFLLALREQALRASLNETNRKLDDMARTDALTGAANRRAFDEFLAEHWAAEAQAPQRELALLLIDVDYFKAFNDRYGHQAGDHCLRLVAEVVGGCLRKPVDLLARWGGEEFAVVLGGADAQTALQVAERICCALEARALPHEGSSCMPVVTVSIGLAVRQPDRHETHHMLLNEADEALYQAKAAGRNRVAVANPAHKVAQAPAQLQVNLPTDLPADSQADAEVRQT